MEEILEIISQALAIKNNNKSFYEQSEFILNKLSDKGYYIIKSDKCEAEPEIEDITEYPNFTGMSDAETNGKAFAIGTVKGAIHADTLVLNWGDRSCFLLMGNCQPIDMRQFNFDELTAIEINGNKFYKGDIN